jgi:hypothetical protein
MAAAEPAGHVAAATKATSHVAAAAKTASDVASATTEAAATSAACKRISVQCPGQGDTCSQDNHDLTQHRTYLLFGSDRINSIKLSPRPSANLARDRSLTVELQVGRCFRVSIRIIASQMNMTRMHKLSQRRVGSDLHSMI